jgi:hypothetical protein
MTPCFCESQPRNRVFGGPLRDVLAVANRHIGLNFYLRVHCSVCLVRGGIDALGSNERLLSSSLRIARSTYHVERNSPRRAACGCGENVCTQASSFITHIDFDAGSRYIQVNTGAAETLTFEVPSGHITTAREVLDQIQWNTCVRVMEHVRESDGTRA